MGKECVFAFIKLTYLKERTSRFCEEDCFNGARRSVFYANLFESKKIVETKLSNTFYKSLLKGQKEIQILSLGRNYIFVKSSKLPNIRAFSYKY